MKKCLDEIKTLINSGYPIIEGETYDEERLVAALEQIAKDLEYSYFEWTCIKGLVDHTGKPVGNNTTDLIAAMNEAEKFRQNGLYVFKDPHPYMGDPAVQRKMRDIHVSLRKADSKKTIILVMPNMMIPVDLQKVITLVEVPLPGEDELVPIVLDALKDLGEMQSSDKVTAKMMQDSKFDPTALTKDKGFLKDLARAGAGLITTEFENTIAKGAVNFNINPHIILTEKAQIVKKMGTLEYYDPNETMESIGGLDNLKIYVWKLKRRFTDEAKAYGLPPAKGILLVGPPGTGKSLSAKVIAKELGVPLVRMDVSDLLSKWYGESSGRVKQALKIAGAVAPCVLWWDEVEKMFASGQGGSEGHEETMRVLGTVLNDFEENQAPILRVATCNHPQVLKAEFLQRFDMIFFVDFPNPEERQEIFSVLLKRVGRDPSKFDLKGLADATENYSGREMGIMIKEAMSTAFADEGREVTTEDIIKESLLMTPMHDQKKEEIQEQRSWATDNARPANKGADAFAKGAQASVGRMKNLNLKDKK
jgi:SpoVK/Ycf46/Vps4 family AAA+-type ATPase